MCVIGGVTSCVIWGVASFLEDVLVYFQSWSAHVY